MACQCLFRFLAAIVAAMMLVHAPGGGAARADDAPRMRLAAEQLLGAQEPSGFFAYNYDFARGVAGDMEPMTSPNLVRQAATAHVLAKYLAHTSDESLRAALETALRAALEAFRETSLPITSTGFQRGFLKTRILSLPFGRATLQDLLNDLGLLYSPSGTGLILSPDGTYEGAWLGATALALLTELEYLRNSGDPRFAEQRAAWLHAILSLRNPGGAFRAAPHYIDEESYFNGESWMALAVYAEAFPEDDSLLAELEVLDAHLLARYVFSPRPRFFHWSTQAAAIRYRTTGEARFLDYIAAQAAHFLPADEEALADGGTVGCASLEGYATAARVLEEERPGDADRQALRARLQRLIEAAMPANRALQIQAGQTRIVLPDGGTLAPPELTEFAGAFLAAADQPLVQIDITAHCLLAMMILSD